MPTNLKTWPESASMAKIEFSLQGGPYNGNSVELPESVLESVNPLHHAVHSRKNAYLYECTTPKSRIFIYKESFPLDTSL